MSIFRRVSRTCHVPQTSRIGGFQKGPGSDLSRSRRLSDRYQFDQAQILRPRTSTILQKPPTIKPFCRKPDIEARKEEKNGADQEPLPLNSGAYILNQGGKRLAPSYSYDGACFLNSGHAVLCPNARSSKSVQQRVLPALIRKPLKKLSKLLRHSSGLQKRPLKSSQVIFHPGPLQRSSVHENLLVPDSSLFRLPFRSVPFHWIRASRLHPSSAFEVEQSPSGSLECAGTPRIGWTAKGAASSLGGISTRSVF